MSVVVCEECEHEVPLADVIQPGNDVPWICPKCNHQNYL